MSIKEKLSIARVILAEDNPKYTKLIIAKALEFSRSMFYRISKIHTRDLVLYQQMLRIYDEVDDTLGHRKLAKLLGIGKNHARRTMKETGIVARKRSSKYFYHGKTNLPPAPNLANQENYRDNFDTGIIYSDIFEFKLLDKTKVRGCFALLKQTGQALSLVFDYSMNAELVQATISNCMTLNNEEDQRHYLIWHDDQGKQYGAQLTRDLILQKGLMHSMSRPGTPTDNPYAERFVSTFKHSVVRRQGYATFGDFLDQAERWINFYNNRRPHQTADNLPPNVFAQKYGWPVVPYIYKLTVY